MSEPMNDPLDLEEEFTCPGCGAIIALRYWIYGVCRDCYGTTDDPYRETRRRALDGGAS